MDKKTKILLIIFIIVAIAQLWIPFSMISKYSNILDKGEVVKMRLIPRDPVSPFKGKYLRLNFQEDNFHVSSMNWSRNEEVYLYYHTDLEGFLRIDSLSREIFDMKNLMKVKVAYFNTHNSSVEIIYPFDKYYIEESKALDAEQKISSLLNTNKNDVYAEISVYDGNAVLKDIIIDEKPILEFLSKFEE